MTHYKKDISLAAVVTAAVMLGGCGSSSSDNAPAVTSSSSSVPVSVSSTADSSMTADSSVMVESSSSMASSSEASVDLVALGKTLYEAQCVDCHGVSGMGNTAIDLGDGPADLAMYIETNMPKSMPANCDADCAEQVTAYINSWTDEAFSAVVEKTGYTIDSIANCGVNSAVASNATALAGNMAGWSHVTTSAPYDMLAMDGASALYDVPGVTSVDGSCNDLTTQKIVLVKKYADWSQQHANGIEVSIANQNKTFADVDKITFEFKLNNSDSVILSKAELMVIYGDTLTDAQYDELDQGKAVFAVSIFAPKSGAKLQTERYIEIDQATLADQWVRVTIPFDEMDIFTGEVWEKTPTTIAAQASMMADRIQINPEVLGTKTANTTYGDVIRNLKGGPDDAGWAALNIPETFKELSITVKSLEVHWK